MFPSDGLSKYGQAPPPPPPRRSNSDLRETSSSSAETLQRSASGTKLGAAAKPNGKGRRQRSKHNKATNTSSAQHLDCGCCKHLDQLSDRLSKMEADTQISMKTLAADMVKLRSERETAWMHVSELQEQNRLMWQRQRELEEQNVLLSRILREQSVERALTASTRLLPQGQQRYGGEPLVPRPPLIAVALNQQQQHQAALSLNQQFGQQQGAVQGPVLNMPKVPHMGTDIW